MSKTLIPDEYIGNKYGRLTVVCLSEAHKQPCKSKMLCECECGNTFVATLYKLLHGRTVSCGCYAREIYQKSFIIDETGNQYGFITVLGKSDVYHDGKAYWKCKCEACGEIFETMGVTLRNQGIKACKPCTMRMMGKSKRTVSIGSRYGKLTVLDIYDANTTENPSKSYKCKCICDCGNTIMVRGAALSNGNTKSCGCMLFSYEALKKSSAKKRRIPIEDWDGFAYDTDDKYVRMSQDYKSWRLSVLKRDNWICKKCNSKISSINHAQVHHLDSFADFPDKRYDVDNGITLCSKCHAVRYKGSFHNTYGTLHNTREQFEEWMKIPLEIKENA